MADNIRFRYWPEFSKALKHLSRKYPHVEDDLNVILTAAFAPESIIRGDALPGYSHQLWKLRVPSRDMGRGKRGGFRVIYYLAQDRLPNTEAVHLMTIYAKTERADLPSKELMQLFQRFLEYLKNKPR